MSTALVRQTVLRIPTVKLLQGFIQLKNNLLIIGEKSMTIAYAWARDLKYVSAVRTKNYKWSNLMCYL